MDPVHSAGSVVWLVSWAFALFCLVVFFVEDLRVFRLILFGHLWRLLHLVILFLATVYGDCDSVARAGRIANLAHAGFLVIVQFCRSLSLAPVLLSLLRERKMSSFLKDEALSWLLIWGVRTPLPPAPLASHLKMVVPPFYLSYGPFFL